MSVDQSVKSVSQTDMLNELVALLRYRGIFAQTITVEVEKLPLLGRARTQQQRRCHDTWHLTAVATERLGKHIRGDVTQQ
jgi:hypothetical protein